MAKKVVSIPLRKKKQPFKRRPKIKKKLKAAFEKFLNYMKSDTYMFSPLIDPQSSLTSSSPVSFGEKSLEPMEKKEEKNLLEEVEDYLKCDFYMYAPLFQDSSAIPPKGMHSPGKDAVRRYVHMQRIEETTTEDGGGTVGTINRQVDHDTSFAPTRRFAVKHILQVEKETVKHVVHQNCLSSSIPGKLGQQKEPSGGGVGVLTRTRARCV